MTGITSAGQRARAHLSSGGITVSDDVNTNRAFTELVKSDHKLDGVAITQQRKPDATDGNRVAGKPVMTRCRPTSAGQRGEHG
jgi:hypothetical protein